jgi:CheY-like chemotaxis protein
MRSDTAEPPGEMRAVSEPASEPGSHRILVVEDNVDNREVLKMQLNAIGHTADVAVDGEDGLLKWRDGNYALILTDYNMPVMNGIEMTKLIRSEEEGESRPSIPIIAITGNAIDSELQHCLDAGMNDYLTKPLTLVSLKDKIASFLDPAGRDHA